MDDKSFDKFLKDKVENYQDPTFDESALNALHQRMDALGYGTPWYVRYNGAIMTAAALTLFTLINFFILRYYNQQDQAELVTELEGLKADRKEMFDMQQQIASISIINRDTVYIYNEAELLYYQRKLAEMDRALTSLQASQTSAPSSEGNLIYLGDGGSISSEDQPTRTWRGPSRASTIFTRSFTPTPSAMKSRSCAPSGSRRSDRRTSRGSGRTRACPLRWIRRCARDARRTLTAVSSTRRSTTATSWASDTSSRDRPSWRSALTRS